MVKLTKTYNVCGEKITISEYKKVDVNNAFWFYTPIYNNATNLCIDYQTWITLQTAYECVEVNRGAGSGWLDEIKRAIEDFEEKYRRLVKEEKELNEKIDLHKRINQLKVSINNLSLKLNTLYYKLNRCNEEKVNKYLNKIQETQTLINKYCFEYYSLINPEVNENIDQEGNSEIDLYDELYDDDDDDNNKIEVIEDEWKDIPF